MTDSKPGDVDKLGRSSMLTCPECHGSLWELDDTQVLRFRCHVGHALTAESLAADQGDALEATLWAAVRAFEERALLSDRMAERARGNKRQERLKLFEERAALSRRQADQIRELLTREPTAGRGETTTPRRRTRTAGAEKH